MARMRKPAPNDSIREEMLDEVRRTLESLGFQSASETPASAVPGADLWVAHGPDSRSRHPVFVFPRGSTRSLRDPEPDRVERWIESVSSPPSGSSITPILVTRTDEMAEALVRGLTQGQSVPASRAATSTRILVLPDGRGTGASPRPHWHRLRMPRSEVLTVATGVLVGMLQSRGTEGDGDGMMSFDFGAMLHQMKYGFHIDVEGSLGATSEEESLMILYQVALLLGYAPGDQASNLHMIVAKPDSPAARIPWFAA